MISMNLFAGKEWRGRYTEQTCGHNGGRREWDMEKVASTCIYTMCKTDSW